MNKQSKIYHIFSWKKYLLLFSIILGSIYSLYEVKQSHDTDLLYFYDPFILILLVAIPLGYHFYKLKYYLDGKTIIAKGLIDRNVSLDKLKYVSVRNNSIDLIDGSSLFPVTLRSDILEFDELTAHIDHTIVNHPEVMLKGATEHQKKWFPKTFYDRNG
jgi:hypothetical protein